MCIRDSYKVSTKKKQYLLRLHRTDYHSKPALSEETKWLAHLNKKSSIPLQTPVLSKSGHYIKKVSTKEYGNKYCSLLTWMDGSMKRSRHNQKTFSEVGNLLAELHKYSKSFKFKHRLYWTADGLIGQKSHWGNINDLKQPAGKGFEIIKKAQRLTLSKLRRYQEKHPKKFGSIHADLHFSNMIWKNNVPKPIDFDDCGYGAHMYDLAVTLLSSQHALEDKTKAQQKKLCADLVDSYQLSNPLTPADLKAVEHYKDARRLMILPWLLTRSEIPRIKKYFHYLLPKTIKYFKKELDR